ncbi:GDSL-type esterase/lipase family protein [Brevibacillus daliensis]|uniref:GDSL-type esterase/lipase family protein n=1 Tax=Brevibacillus daliensis TaxID=2892995 RepID=UPI001E2856C7|nr:GDSL-type esterase/lipase family protein [Brevibacillus daliensis]
MPLSKRNALTKWMLLLSLLAMITLAVGFGFALAPKSLASSDTPGLSSSDLEDDALLAPPSAILPKTGTLKLVSMGDSLTRGVGDSTGKGYIEVFKQTVATNRNQPIQLSNLAVSGYESVDLLRQLEQPNVKRLLSEANLIMFTIGGNDLFRQSGGVFGLELQKVESATDKLATHYDQILTKIREVNPHAPIIYTELYNPFGDTEIQKDSGEAVLAWNNQAALIAQKYSNIITIPTYDLFWKKENKYLYTDHFHPNKAGYQQIAERLVQALP